VADALGRILPRRLSGAEAFHSNGAPIGCDLLDFWRSSGSDLVVNIVRGQLAEYIVAHALRIPTTGVRDGWAVYDLTTPDGIRVEVKSGSYLQSWFQKEPSVITFSVKKTRAWNPNTNEFEGDQRRHADVYVLALLAHRDKATLDPLDIAQWQFYVLSTRVLDARTRSQQSITLPSLERLNAGPYAYAALSQAVAQAARGSQSA